MRTLLSLIAVAIAVVSCERAPLPTRSAFVARAGAVSALIPLAPIRLTASDGTGLGIAELRARAVVEDPLAFTELHLTFENPEPRVLEGRFAIALPPGASVSRFAMKVGEEWQEGEVVELQAARVAFEDFLHQKRDPALLEQAPANEFTARVFPIPANGRKEIVISYSQEVTHRNPYFLPLRGLPEIGLLDIEIASGDAPPWVFRKEHVASGDDVTLNPAPLAPPRETALLRSGDLMVARVSGPVHTQLEPIEDAIVLFDTSASRALGFEDQIHLLQRIAYGPGHDAHITVACFDQTVATVYEGTGSALGPDAIRAIRARQALGASDLALALAWANKRAKAAGARRVVIVSDGVATAGATDADAVREAAHALRDAGVERIDAVAVGGIRDEAGMKRLVTAGLPHDGVVVDGTSDDRELARRLTRSTQSNVPIEVASARWWFPRTADGLQAEDEVVVYAEVPAARAVSIAMGGTRVEAGSPRTADRALLERSLGQAKIAALLGDKQTPETKQRIVSLSTSLRVVSPYTALLLLESEADYARFQIDRRSLGDILSIDGGHVVGSHRAPLKIATVATNQWPRDGALTGVVEDAADRKPLPDAVVTASSSSLGGEQVVVTDSTGFFRIPDLPAGSYLLRIEKDGYRTYERRDVPLVRGATLRVNAELLPSTIRAEEVAVSARAPVVDVGSSSVSTAVKGEFTKRVPVTSPTNEGAATRPFESVAEVVPGTKADAYGVSITGASSPENSYLVDGLAVGGTTQGVPGGVVGGVGGGVVGGAPQAAAPPLAADPLAKARSISAYSGRFASVMDAIKERDAKRALEEAATWHAEEPGDEMALVALGEALEASGDAATAARAYGSLIDLFPSRADIRRFAGERLERVKGGDALALDTFEKAVAQRPDHPSSHRLLAFARLKRRDFAGAFDALAVGLRQPYPGGRFLGVPRILREDLGLIAAAWIKAEPRRGDEVRRRLSQAGVTLEQEPSVRFVLNWETDANDVDLHVYDARGNHAFYGLRQLPTGGELYADVTTGYGPECFAMVGGRRAGPYALEVHYYARGPMGFGMGKVEILEHDGKGGLRFEERPFVVMTDQAVVDLGKY